MQNPRKKIILNEILFWKQNKLLPEQYCNFLMTLYTEGNEIEEEENVSHKKAVKAKEKRNNILVFFILAIIAVALLSALFLVTQLIWVVAFVIGILALILMMSAYRIAKKNALIAPFLQVISALLIFGLSVKISLSYFPGNMLILVSLLLLNCIMWLITGIKLKLMYFTISGALGIIVIIGYQLMNRF